MAFPNKNEVVNCIWCGLAIDDWGNNRTNIKKNKVHTNGNCYAYLVYYEKNIRQLHAYMKSLPEKDQSTIRGWFMKFGNNHSVHLGSCELKILKTKNIPQTKNLITDPIPV